MQPQLKEETLVALRYPQNAIHQLNTGVYRQLLAPTQFTPVSKVGFFVVYGF